MILRCAGPAGPRYVLAHGCSTNTGDQRPQVPTDEPYMGCLINRRTGSGGDGNRISEHQVGWDHMTGASADFPNVLRYYSMIGISLFAMRGNDIFVGGCVLSVCQACLLHLLYSGLLYIYITFRSILFSKQQ